MPAEGMDWLPKTELLTYEEIARVARVCVERFGFDSVRLTGGEPLVRAHITRLIAHARAARRRHRTDDERREAGRGRARSRRRPGLKRVNVSLDTLDRATFLALTKRDELARVIAGIDAAIEAGLAPVKVNAVVMRGVNDGEVVDLARLRPRQGRRHAVHRVHAARRAGRVEPGKGRSRRGDPRADRRGVPARSGRGTRRRTGDALPVSGRQRRRRRDRRA